LESKGIKNNVFVCLAPNYDKFHLVTHPPHLDVHLRKASSFMSVQISAFPLLPLRALCPHQAKIVLWPKAV